MRRKELACFLGVVIFLLVSAAKGQTRDDDFATGKLIDKVTSRADQAQSYALYLPSAYSRARKFPILYCFDPGARGQVPVERFENAAEKYNYIIVGSNNSRNGPNQPLNDIIRTLWEDTHARLSIDKKRVYVAGFSGGARVAISVGYSLHGLVAGVIACSGGFPSQIGPTTPRSFALFATAGLEDFNNPEMQSLSRTLEGSGVPNRLAIFAGGHEWLPTTLATEAVEWMEIQAIRAGLRDKDEGLIESIFRKTLARARAAEETRDSYLAYSFYAALALDFQGLRDVSEFQQKAAALKATKEVREAFKREKQMEEEQERRVQNVDSLIGVLLQSGNNPLALSDLKNAIAVQRRAAKAEEPSSNRIVARRVIDSLFIESIEQGNLALFQKNVQTAVLHFSVGTEIQPDNARVFYQLARALALAKENRKALDALQTAAEKGFADPGALKSSDFVGLQNEKRFKETYDLVRKNREAMENKRNNHPRFPISRR